MTLDDTDLLARLLLVLSLVLPNLVWANVAVVNVRGAAERGRKGGGGGAGLGEPLKGVGVGEDCAEDDGGRHPREGRAAANGDEHLGASPSAPKFDATASMGRKHCASGLKVLVTSLSAEHVS